MTIMIASPGRYIQGVDELGNIGKYARQLGTKALVVISLAGAKRVGEIIKYSFVEAKMSYLLAEFDGECSRDEIDRLCGLCASESCDVIIRIGGGKVLDTAKAVAYYQKNPIVICPTVAATDAPCSALTVIYTPNGIFQEYLFLPRNPDIVLVDSMVIAKAPVRLLVAGMGDALATYFEARAVHIKNGRNTLGSYTTLAAFNLAELCYKTLLAEGVKAKLAVSDNVCTPAVEKIIEANTFLSGIGFESGGVAGAHAVHNGLTVNEETHASYHGEKVAFGVIVQLVLEDRANEQIKEVLDFCLSVGLPVTLSDLGITDTDTEKLMQVAKFACMKSEGIRNLATHITPEIVCQAIIAADAIGRYYKTSFKTN